MSAATIDDAPAIDLIGKDVIMKWRQKSLIQNLVAKLPSNLSYTAYYFLQRKFGGLRSINPTSRLIAGIKIAQHIYKHGGLVESKRFLEIGTGHQINLPLALWLCGASEIVTVDLNPYLKAELVFEDLSYMRHHPQEIRRLFDDVPQSRPFFTARFRQLIAPESDLQRLLARTNIRYLAPVDTACLNFESQSVDYHVSFTVLEHIPPKTLENILIEGKRLLRPDGLFIHYIDFSDHFSHSDNSISSINFLQFTDEEWERLAGNRYMYHNRLRVDDFADLFKSIGLKILFMAPGLDEKALAELKQGFPLHERFRNKDARTIATGGAWIVASARGTG